MLPAGGRIAGSMSPPLPPSPRSASGQGAAAAMELASGEAVEDCRFGRGGLGSPSSSSRVILDCWQQEMDVADELLIGAVT